MLETLGKTQQNLLQVLQANKDGLPIDVVAELLGITRTAVRQHITALESLGFVSKGQAISSGGRPSQFYVLSRKGIDLFPKQYSLFSEVLLRGILAEKGAEGLGEWLQQLGRQVAQGFTGQVTDNSLHGRLIRTVNIMNTLAYDAKLVSPSDDGHAPEHTPAIEAVNCVYHDLAAEHPQVCQFDVALLSGLSQADVTHEQCIQRGDNVCRFCFHSKAGTV